MNQNEKELVLRLCRFRNPDRKALAELLEKGAMTSAVLGELFWNRAAVVACDVLEKEELMPQVPREARTALRGARTQNREYNRSFFRCVGALHDTLRSCGEHYAMLKGAYLCAKYPEGCRTSNDVDLLVPPEFLSEIGEALLRDGYCQGAVKNGVFIPARREEIIRSRMLRGETVPYIKEVNLPYLRYFEVDINFSLDYKNGKTELVRELVERAVTAETGGMEIRTLACDDFFLHLCAHLYKEATTYPWIRMKRDMTLYKYIDLYMLLHEMTMPAADAIAARAYALGLCTECYFAVSETVNLFGDESGAGMHILRGLPDVDMDGLFSVISPEEKKEYRYTERDTVRRFFCADREKLLEEVGIWKP